MTQLELVYTNYLKKQYLTAKLYSMLYITWEKMTFWRNIIFHFDVLMGTNGEKISMNPNFRVQSFNK